jgi:hypothetical protein
MHPHNVVYNPGTMVRLAEQSTPPASARRWTPVTSCGRASNPCGQSKRWAISCTAQPRRTSASHSAAGTPCTLSRRPENASWDFVAVGRGKDFTGRHHDAAYRREFLQALERIDADIPVNIEHEDQGSTAGRPAPRR